MDQDNQLESQVIFGHLENTLAVRCLARNEMVAVSREIKLVANGEILHHPLALKGCPQCSLIIYSHLSFAMIIVISPATPVYHLATGFVVQILCVCVCVS